MFLDVCSSIQRSRNQFLRKALAACFAALMVGCASFEVPKYSISSENNVRLNRLKGVNIGVAEFAGPEEYSEICRLGFPILPPKGQKFSEYLRTALIREFEFSEIYSEANAKTAIAGEIRELRFSSNSDGRWVIEVRFYNQTGWSLLVREEYEFQIGSVAETRCHDTAVAFVPAVQSLIGRLVASPEFNQLVKR